MLYSGEIQGFLQGMQDTHGEGCLPQKWSQRRHKIRDSIEGAEASPYPLDPPTHEW